MAASTVSLAILPSAPMAYSQAPTPLDISSPSPSKRPRLSLNTTNIKNSTFGKGFGKGSTSLRLDTLSATSPTARNTFRNAHTSINAHRKSNALQQKPMLTPLATDVSQPNPQASQDDANSPVESASSSTTTASYSSAGSSTDAPYKLSYNVTSILSNGPLPKTMKRSLSFTQSKPMFPAAKKVAFRSPLTEDIKNSKYTLKHSDIESSTSTISTLELSPPEKTSLVSEPRKADGSDTKENVEDNNTPSPQTGDKRESSDEEDSDSCPATPLASRSKRHRQWVWTLAPVGKSERHESDNDVKSHS